MAPSNPFLEEEEGGVKKTSRLADLATELLTVATSRRSLRESPLTRRSSLAAPTKTHRDLCGCGPHPQSPVPRRGLPLPLCPMVPLEAGLQESSSRCQTLLVRLSTAGLNP